MDSKIFRYSGVGSKAWYISRIKIGFKDGRSGFTYLRESAREDGKTLSFDEIKSAMSQLHAAGYVKVHSKPGAPRSDKWEVSSFGHRYLEEHKAELEEKPVQDTGAVKAGVMHHVPQVPQFVPSPPAPKDDAVTRVAKAGITLGQEIEKHKARNDKKDPIILPASISSPPDEQGSDTPTGLESGEPEKNSPLENTNNLAADVKEKLKDLLLEKFLDKTLDQVLSFKSISIHDFLEYVEKKK